MHSATPTSRRSGLAGTLAREAFHQSRSRLPKPQCCKPTASQLARHSFAESGHAGSSWIFSPPPSLAPFPATFLRNPRARSSVGPSDLVRLFSLLVSETIGESFSSTGAPPCTRSIDLFRCRAREQTINRWAGALDSPVRGRPSQRPLDQLGVSRHLSLLTTG